MEWFKIGFKEASTGNTNVNFFLPKLVIVPLIQKKNCIPYHIKCLIIFEFRYEYCDHNSLNIFSVFLYFRYELLYIILHHDYISYWASISILKRSILNELHPNDQYQTAGMPFFRLNLEFSQSTFSFHYQIWNLRCVSYEVIFSSFFLHENLKIFSFFNN